MSPEMLAPNNKLDQLQSLIQQNDVIQQANSQAVSKFLKQPNQNNADTFRQDNSN